MEGNGGNSNVIDHPNRRLLLKIEEQQKQIQGLIVDVGVLRDLLIRTIRIMAKYEKEGVLKLPNREDQMSELNTDALLKKKAKKPSNDDPQQTS